MKWPPSGQRKGLLRQHHSTPEQNERLSSTWNDHKFDETTGQVFTETTASIPSADDRDWTRRTRIVRGPDFLDERTQTERETTWNMRQDQSEGYLEENRNSGMVASRKCGGVRVLQNIALECAVQNVLDITSVSLGELPVHLIRRVWDIVRRRCSGTISFDTWATFSRFVHEEEGIHPDILKYTESFPFPRLPLTAYATPLISIDFNFITFLSITVSISLPDLVKLSHNKNLGVLEIVNTKGREPSDFPLIGDRLIRAWQQAAVNSQAFPALRVLRLWNHEDLTNNSLAFLNGFPSLAVYDIKGCSFNQSSGPQARSLGWKRCVGEDLVGLLEAVCDQRTAFIKTQTGSSSQTPVANYRPSVGIHRMPRAQIAAFLSNRNSPKPTEKPAMTPAVPSSDNKLTSAKRTKSHKSQKPKDSHVSSIKFRFPSSWDNTLYTVYSSIGELRNDTDLARAGVPLYDQAILGTDLITSIPVASIRLGPAPFELSSTGKMQNTSTSHFFLRIKAPSADTAGKEENALVKLGLEMVQSTASTESGAMPVKKVRVAMMKNKKRKLDDVLGSFS